MTPRKTHLERLAEKEHREHPWTTLEQARQIVRDHLKHKRSRPSRVIRQTYKQHLKDDYKRKNM